VSLVLHHYFRSSCSWRVRIALVWKGLPFDVVPVHLLRDEQRGTEHRALNPSAQVPVLLDGGVAIAQSLAIIEYLDETHASPTLYPGTAVDRARARQLAEVINSGIQPLQNLDTMRVLRTDFGLTEQAARQFAHDVIARGLAALEALLMRYAGRYSVGDAVSVADACLVPQLYNARRFEVDLSPYPTATRIEAELLGLEAFSATHPDRYSAG
jgi:maleylpyruvate isomerase